MTAQARVVGSTITDRVAADRRVASAQAQWVHRCSTETAMPTTTRTATAPHPPMITDSHHEPLTTTPYRATPATATADSTPTTSAPTADLVHDTSGAARGTSVIS